MRCRGSASPVLQDSFDDGSLEPNWDIENGLNFDIAEADGTLNIGIPQYRDNMYAAVVSREAYDMTDCGVVVRFVQPFDPMSTGYTYFGVRVTLGNTIEIGHALSRIDLKRYVNGILSLTSVVYRAEAHAYLRIREAGGRTLWEASATGEEWTILRNEPDVIPLSNVHVMFGGGTFPGSTVAPGTAQFDDLEMRP